MLNAYDIARIRYRLESDWYGFADRFIPMYENSTMWRMKEKLPLSPEQRKRELDIMRVRNILHSFTLQGRYEDYTVEEIAENKLSRLLRICNRRPELEPIILEYVN